MKCSAALKHTELSSHFRKSFPKMVIAQMILPQHGDELRTLSAQASTGPAGDAQWSHRRRAALGCQSCCTVDPWHFSKGWLMGCDYALWVPAIVQEVVVISRSEVTSLP